MSYRAPGKAPLTDWGRFLVRQRQEHDWSATQAFEALRAGLGLSEKSRSAYLPFEFDKIPDARQEAFFREFFGGGPTERDQVAAPVIVAADQSVVVAALDRQSAAIEALVLELRKLATGQLELTMNVAAVVGRLEGSPIPLEDPPAMPPEGSQGGPQRPRSTSAGTK